MSKKQVVLYGIAKRGKTTLLPQEVLDRFGLEPVQSGGQEYPVEHIEEYFKVTIPARRVLRLLGYGTALDRAWDGSDGFYDIYIAQEDMMYVKYEPGEPDRNGWIDITEKGWDILCEYDFEGLRKKVQDSIKTVDDEKLVDIARILGIKL